MTNDQWSEIPDRTKLNSLSINDGVAIIDLNQEFIDGLTPNHNISLILDSIKKTIFQFDEIKAFKITIEGKEYKGVNGSYLSMLINKEINIILPNNTIPYGPVDPPPSPVIYLDAGHGGSESGAISEQHMKKILI